LPACRSEWRGRIAQDDGDRDRFVEEVRRTAPFIPFIGGRVRAPFEWRGHAFGQGDWVLIDLWGTDRDPRSWNEPDAFRPERFAEKPPNAFDLIPQGGGDPALDHRCPGEEITIAVMRAAARLLTAAMRYDLPAQDLTVNLAHVPARPRSGLRLRSVRGVPRAAKAEVAAQAQVNASAVPFGDGRFPFT